MQMKPMELNVIEQIEGTGLYLYDTCMEEVQSGEKKNQNHIRLLEYGYGVLDGRELMSWSSFRILRKLQRKIRKGKSGK